MVLKDHQFTCDLGEEMSLEHMLYGLMLRSGNDAATAIAEHIGGSLEGFVMMMNDKAEQLGMSQSHFENPHGLDTRHALCQCERYGRASRVCVTKSCLP